jgi:hypothetical protein
MAVSAMFAYQQDELRDFNFLGEKMWGKKKFNNAEEYFREFSLVFNPANIENEYFDKYQGKDVPLEEQFWRAYLDKFFPNINPKTIREVMKKWGYDYTEF